MAARDLAIEVLGPLTVRVDGEPVSVGGPRPRALLVRLVVAGELVATDRLVDDLWAGDPPRSAINTLQTYVSMLRRALGDADQSIVVRDGPGYRIATDAVRLDAERFTTLVADARATVDPAERLRFLDDALALWAGPALVDVADAEWARPAAQRLEEARLGAIEDRIDALLALGAHGAAVAELPGLVDAHPLRERLAGQLVLALYRSGRQAEALRAYDRTREVLVEELGVEPGPELAALQRAVLEQDPVLDAPAVAVPAPSSPASGATTSRPVTDGSAGDLARAATTADGPSAARDLLPSHPPALPPGAARYARRPIVGRDPEREHLRAAFAAAAAGQPRLVLVSGEPGIGKTRLAASLAADVHDGGGTVLWGACPRETLGPFQPFAAALREYLRSLPGRDASRVVEALGPLTSLLPELGGDPGESSDPGHGRFRLFEAVASALALLAGEGGVVLVLDDVHWADPDTCSLLTHVLRREATPAPLVVATVRSHDAEPNPALVEAIADLQRDRLVTRLALGGLTTDAIRQLGDAIDATSDPGSPSDPASGSSSEAAAGSTLDVEDADDLQRATGGNPYFVEELLAARREGSTGPTAADGAEVPASIRDVLQARFHRLGEPVRAVLDVAALVGASFDLAVVDRAGDVHGDDLLDRVDRAVDAGLLIESTEVLGRYAFAHELVRQVLVEQHGATRRARIHLRIADALEVIEADGGVIDTSDIPSAVAHHRLAALPLGDVEVAAAASVHAARQAIERLAFADARMTAEAALAALDRAGAVGSPASRAELLLELGRAHRAAGDLTAAGAAFAEAVELGRVAGRADLEADAALGAIGPRPTGTRLDYEPPDPDLLVMAERALDSLGDDPTRRAALLAARVWLLPRTSPIEERLAAVDEALALAEASGEPALEARALLARHAVLLVPDRLDERIDAVEQAIARAEEAGAADVEVLARVAAATDLVERADIAAVRDQVDHLTALADRLHQPAFHFYPRTFGVLLSLMAGDHVAAEAKAWEMFEATKVLNTAVPGEVALVSRLYQVARDRGTLGELFPLLGGQLEGNTQPFLHAAYALGAAEVGELAIAREQMALVVGTEDDLAGDVDRVPREGVWLGTTALTAEAAARLGDEAAAVSLARRLTPYAGHLVAVGAMFCLGSVDRYVGLSHRAAGDLDLADRWLAAGIELDRRVGALPFVVRGLAERAVALQARGRPGDAGLAEELATEAIALADELGLAAPWALLALDEDRFPGA